MPLSYPSIPEKALAVLFKYPYFGFILAFRSICSWVYAEKEKKRKREKVKGMQRNTAS